MSAFVSISLFHDKGLFKSDIRRFQWEDVQVLKSYVTGIAKNP